MKKKIKCWVCHRLSEPSTWAALAVPLGTFATQIPKPYSYIAYSFTAMCAAAGIILGEDTNETDSK